MDSTLTSTQAIQAIVAPAVMISSMGLFLLGLNNRQVAIFSRIRTLNEEKRHLLRTLFQGQELDYCEDIRCLSIESQLSALLKRAWYVRSAIICHTMAVAFFVLTSFAIGLNFLLPNSFTQDVALYFFIIGMFLVLTGVLGLGIDEWIAYSVILIEVKRSEDYNSCKNGH